MARGNLSFPYRALNIGGRKHILLENLWPLLTPSSEVVSTLHQRPRRSTHINTIRAQRTLSTCFMRMAANTNLQIAPTTGVRPPSLTSLPVGIAFTKWHVIFLAHLLQGFDNTPQRRIGNIIAMEKGHMRLSPQARKTWVASLLNFPVLMIYHSIRMTLVLSCPGATQTQQAKRVNALAGILRTRRITRDRSVLEVASTVTGSTFPSRRSRSSHAVCPLRSAYIEPESDAFPRSPRTRMLQKSRSLTNPANKQTVNRMTSVKRNKPLRLPK
jgi:hypothetical protein